MIFRQRQIYGAIAISIFVLFTLFSKFYPSYSTPLQLGRPKHPNLITRTDIQLGVTKKPVDNGQRVKATFVSFFERGDIWAMAETIQELETRFNQHYHYDWVFISQSGFTTEFKTIASRLVSGNTYFGMVSKSHWEFPSHIDPEKSFAARQKMEEEGILHGYDLTYRHLSRYWMKFFQHHELLKDYDYFWKVEPGSKFTCDIQYDVFKFMKSEKKKYGFMNAFRTDGETMPTIYDTTKQFIEKYQDQGIFPKNNSEPFLFAHEGTSFSRCSFWDIFEIGDLNFFRSEEYKTFAEEFDQAGGIYYERWGIAPLRTIGVSLLLKLKEIHFFTDFGFEHLGLTMCPTELDMRLQNKCTCNQKESIMWSPKFCMHKFFISNGLQRPKDWREAINKV